MYTRFSVTTNSHIAEIVFNRPQKLNTFDFLFFEEFHKAIKALETDPEVRVILIWSEGKYFTAGLDLKEASKNFTSEGEDKVQENLKFYYQVKNFQASISSLELCPKPIIVAVDGPCIGGGVDLITSADIRLASSTATFSVKETQIAIVADLGTLQRIQRVVPKGIARELVFTGSSIDATRALSCGLVNAVYPNKEILLKEARSLCAQIATNSPLVVQGSKVALNYAQEHGTNDSLDQVALWNVSFMRSPDLLEAFSAFLEKRKPVFKSNL
eukprot:TRINITY_DN6789_c0_g1_i1.p1 TRINITY_DN6789_c0_g1~~TRINITY_DN6789_c0_g1_i1.p1  ORF type:complete len:271 (-),score=55.29 TRINITY_DN6789_c0_g1_i1:31-843(-)